MTEYTNELECPCCGDVGAVANADGFFHDGQDLVCECLGCVSMDAETDPCIITYCTDTEGCPMETNCD